MNPKQKDEYIEGLNTYYKLKESYQTNIQKNKFEIIKKKGLSWKEKRKEYSRLKPKCINCKRPVSTLFYTTSDLGERTIGAKCGDKKNPCPLKIEINVGDTHILSNQIQDTKTEINEYKKQVIFDKNNLLFGYISTDQAISNFDELKENINASTKRYEILVEFYTNIVDNPENEAELKDLLTKLYLNIDSLKKAMKDYERTLDAQYVRDGIEMYINEMIPQLEEIMKKMYVYSGVEYDIFENVYKLIQIPYAYSIEPLEINLGEKTQGVVSMQVGMNEVVKKPKKVVAKIQSYESEAEESDADESEAEESEADESEAEEDEEADESEAEESEAEEEEDELKK